MSYFSPRATWMSLVESPGSFTFSPEPGSTVPSLRAAMFQLGSDWSGEDTENGPEIPSDLQALQSQRDLRHRLFFHPWHSFFPAPRRQGN